MREGWREGGREKHNYLETKQLSYVLSKIFSIYGNVFYLLR